MSAVDEMTWMELRAELGIVARGCLEAQDERDRARAFARRWKGLAGRLWFWKVQCGEMAIEKNVRLRAEVADLKAELDRAEEVAEERRDRAKVAEREREQARADWVEAVKERDKFASALVQSTAKLIEAQNKSAEMHRRAQSAESKAWKNVDAILGKNGYQGLPKRLAEVTEEAESLRARVAELEGGRKCP